MANVGMQSFLQLCSLQYIVMWCLDLADMLSYLCLHLCNFHHCAQQGSYLRVSVVDAAMHWVCLSATVWRQRCLLWQLCCLPTGIAPAALAAVALL